MKGIASLTVAVLILVLLWSEVSFGASSPQGPGRCGTCEPAYQPDPPFAQCGGCNAAECTPPDVVPEVIEGSCTYFDEALDACTKPSQKVPVQTTEYTCLSAIFAGCNPGTPWACTWDVLGAGPIAMEFTCFITASDDCPK